MANVPTFIDFRGHELSLYREDNTVAVNTVQPTGRLKTGKAYLDNTFHEVYVGGSDLDRLIAELTQLRDIIAENPAKEN